MIRFRHKHDACTTELIRYIGSEEYPFQPGMIVRPADWQFPGGTYLKPGARNYLRCPDCGRKTGVASSQLDVIQD